MTGPDGADRADFGQSLGPGGGPWTRRPPTWIWGSAVRVAGFTGPRVFPGSWPSRKR